VLGLQESNAWGWDSVATIGSIIVGILILVLFVAYERRVEQPLISIKAFVDNRPFAVDNVLTLFLFFTWLAVFFFGSIYFQVSVGQEPTQAGFSILTMFYSFFIASRIGGGMYDKMGAKHPVSLGLAAIAVGLWLWATELSSLSHGGTLAGMLVTGAGFGLAMSALNTDALNRAPVEIRGEASGIIQTFRNFGSALGMAILGTIVLGALGPNTTPSGFADALDTAFKVGAIVMAVGFVIARAFMPDGKAIVEPGQPEGAAHQAGVE
jgi:fucose permease